MKSQTHNQKDEIWLLLDSRDVGGIETHILQLAQGLKQFQQSVRVIFLCKYEQTHPLTISLNNANISYRFLDGTLRELLDYTRHHCPSVIHSHGYKAAIYSRLLRLSLLTSHQKIRFINTFHAGEVGKGKLALYDIIDRWSARFSHHNFAVSELISQRVPSQTTVLNNFIDTTNLKPSTGELIAFVGRLSHEKAPDRFIELAKKHPNHSFHIYGSGPMEKELIKHLPNNVIFHGHQDSMDTIWNDIGLLIICSRYEGLPMTALEAMGRGIPVISTPVGNISKLIQPEMNGWITEPEALSQALLHWFELSSINKVEIQHAAQRTIQDQFSSNAVIPQILKVYEV
ncbi:MULTISPECIES: glycosyltransferase family 4 protein [Aliivibrio]|uniref:Glycosyltransferase n=1 Tax=Aliivibrio finisterrensis TaxID=511998 RepID=A0A4Q5KTX3_9GAMM|nr:MULTISPECIES: glycosyltransferase family 4 protein [Aliivibrio]MDD9179340.1 glycosyltransferase family 4 protein [Aliivibrio sp. A6]RYU51391.1 glycosyltransferase [Aliivibrio finisterrensis]RYU52571.1 glycosyltransferase [Aliivibrio finisterrensis]RYU58101.1 glycosyltransferase [Aliivibrio finisterrensis]RYU64589.1 glycosyltransferase [Aliivibrio finisterrensis]